MLLATNTQKMSPDERHVWFVVWPQSFSGLLISGLFYGWGALTEPINEVFNPEDPRLFANQHGTFTGVIILVLSVMPMPLVRLVIQRRLLTEFQVQALGMVFTSLGLVIGGLALQYKILPLLYIGCAVPCGFGALFVYQRLVFIHQLWFKRIGKYNLGAGVFGFGIGLWTVVFFLISVPMLQVLPVHSILYIYASFCIPSVLYPLLTSVDIDKIDELKQPQPQISSSSYSESTRTLIERPSCCAAKSPSEAADDDNSAEAQDIIISTISVQGDVEKAIDVTTATSAAAATYSSGDEEAKAGKESYERIEGSENSASNETNHNHSTFAITDTVLLKEAAMYNIEIDTHGEYDLTFAEICQSPQTWVLTMFFTAVLTPGWGIKLASIAMMTELFSVTPSYAAVVTSIYVSAYALGRLFSGFLAESVGVFRAYDILIACTTALLIVAPQTAVYLPHGSSEASGCKAFVVLICFIGLMYGGSIALFYSIVFDIFGARNYRAVFSVAIFGFGFAVMVGGLSSAYSFSEQPHEVPADHAVTNAVNWFYSMAGGCVFAWICLHALRPLDYSSQLKKRIVSLKESEAINRSHAHTA